MNSFYKEHREQSIVKSTIVSKYFDAWAQIMMNVQDRYAGRKGDRIGYIDLFAGPGRFKDGTDSTPILILKKAIANERLHSRLVALFNDKDEKNTVLLKKSIAELPGIQNLKYPPIVRTEEVGDNFAELFEQMSLIPSLFFVDPWGYKGLSLRLVNSVLKDWGCDCIFFFNYNRINPGLANEAVRTHMDGLFGHERAESLRQRIERYASIDRELLIVEEMCQVLRDTGARYVLPFRFRDEHGNRTSHHLFFASKAFKGYETMKNIMAKASSSNEQGVPSFEYNPVDREQSGLLQFLFELSRPLEDLADMLLREFSGKTLSRKKIYEQHNVDRPYIKKNYRQVLMELEKQGKIKVSEHRMNTFGDNVMVTFPVYIEESERRNGI